MIPIEQAVLPIVMERQMLGEDIVPQQITNDEALLGDQPLNTGFMSIEDHLDIITKSNKQDMLQGFDRVIDKQRMDLKQKQHQ